MNYVALVAGVVAFGLGYSLAAYKADAEIESMISDHAKRVADSEREYAKKLESEKNQRELDISSLLEQIRESNARERELVIRADRLQRDLADRARRPTAGDSACGACEVRLAGCTKLLSEGVGLVAEGAALSERIAVRKDGLADYSK